MAYSIHMSRVGTILQVIPEPHISEGDWTGHSVVQTDSLWRKCQPWGVPAGSDGHWADPGSLGECSVFRGKRSNNRSVKEREEERKIELYLRFNILCTAFFTWPGWQNNSSEWSCFTVNYFATTFKLVTQLSTARTLVTQLTTSSRAAELLRWAQIQTATMLTTPTWNSINFYRACLIQKLGTEQCALCKN